MESDDKWPVVAVVGMVQHHSNGNREEAQLEGCADRFHNQAATGTYLGHNTSIIQATRCTALSMKVCVRHLETPESR